jgi:hypothetical protein
MRLRHLRFLVALVSPLLGCSTVGGLGASLMPKSSFVDEPTAPTHLGLKASSSKVSATVESVIGPGGPGSWYKDAKWYEFVVTLKNTDRAPLTVASVHLVDPRGVYIHAEGDHRALVDLSEKYQRDRDTAVYGSQDAIQAAASMPGGVGLNAAAFALGPVGMVAGPAYMYWRKHVYKADAEKLAAEISRRSAGMPLTLAPGATVTTSFFFPLVPAPRQLVLEYHSGTRFASDQLTVSLAAIQDKKAAVSAHPAAQ